jgi:hypothetical protein
MSRPSNELQVQEWLAGGWWLVAGVVPSRFSHHLKMRLHVFPNYRIELTHLHGVMIQKTTT